MNNLTSINVEVGNIVQCAYEAIVNSAHHSLLKGSGVCGAIHNAAGKELEKECVEKYGSCEVGEAVITSAYALPCKYVIHTVTPHYFDIYTKQKLSYETKISLLSKCYISSLSLANQYELKSIAFPCLAMGKHGFPIEIGCEIAIKAIYYFLTMNKTSIEYIKIFCGNHILETILTSTIKGMNRH